MGGRQVGTIPEQDVRPQEGKEGIHMDETVGMGCWSLSGVKEVSMCMSRGRGCDSLQRFVHPGELIK